MNWFGFVPAVISANMMDHVRAIVVYDFRKAREEYPVESLFNLPAAYL